MIHVARSILIRCDVDGLSRGNLQLEKLDEEIYIYLPVNRDPIFCSPALLTWIKSWISDPFSLDEPSDWFSRSQHTYSTSVRSKSELWVWYFPPTADFDALE